MERTIHKYEIPLIDHALVEMPQGAKILAVHEHYGKAYLWALIDPAESRKKKRSLRVAGTGHSFEYTDQCVYIGTIFLAGGSLVLHVFEFKH